MSEIKDSKLLYMFDQGHTADGTSSQTLIVVYNRYICMNSPRNRLEGLISTHLKIDTKIRHRWTDD